MRFGKDQIHLMELPSMDPKEGRPEHGGKCIIFKIVERK